MSKKNKYKKFKIEKRKHNANLFKNKIINNIEKKIKTKEIQQVKQNTSIPILEKKEENEIDYLLISKYIPIRISYEERKLLKLIQAALSVSEYTNNVDIIKFGKNQR
jgi:hypothetical protein